MHKDLALKIGFLWVFIITLVVYVFVFCVCDYYKFYLFKLDKVNDLIDKLIDVYCALFTLIVLGEYVLDSCYKRFNTYIPKIEQFFQVQQKNNDLYNKVINSNTDSNNLDANKKNEICNKYKNKFRDSQELGQKLGSSLERILQQKADFKWILFVVVLIIVILIGMQNFTFSVEVCEEINTIQSAFLSFLVVAPVIIVYYLFLLLESAHSENVVVNKK